jgi:hypothetical protein
MAISNLADTYHPAEGDTGAWLDELTGRLPALTRKEDSLSADADFTGNVVAMTCAQIQTSQAVDQPAEWLTAVLDGTLGGLNPRCHEEFSRAFQQTYYVSCFQTETLPEALPLLVSALAERAIEADDPPLADDQERRTLLASVVADAVFGMWTFGDREFQSRPAWRTPFVLGEYATVDPEFVVETIATGDRRLADRDVMEFFLEQADDDSVTGLRDRFVGHAYAGAARALNEEDDRQRDAVLDGVTFHDGRAASTRLYRAGLRSVVDGDEGIARPVLELAWQRHDYTVVGSTAHSHACAAGVVYAAHLALGDDAEQSPGETIDTAAEAAETLPNAVRTLADAFIEDDPDTDADALTDDIDPEAEQHDLDELEALACAQLLSIRSAGPSAYYATALRSIAQDGSPEDVNDPLVEAWTGRDDADDDETRRDATAAGVLLLAHVEADVADPDVIDEGTLAAAVEEHRGELSRAVLSLFEFVTEGDTDADAEALRAQADEDDMDKGDLETFVFAGLLDALQGDSETPTAPDDLTDVTEGRTATEAYRDGISAILDNDPEQAISAFHGAWSQLEDTETDYQQNDAVAAGVILLAHADADMIDEDLIDRTAVLQEVALHRPALSDPVTKLFDATVDDEAVDTDVLLADIDGDEDVEDLGRSEREALAVAGLLDTFGLASVDIEEVYTTALSAILNPESDPEDAVRALAEAWEQFDTTEDGDGQRMTTAAGVGLLAYVEIGVLDSDALDRGHVAEAVDECRDGLREPVTALYDACTGNEPGITPDELRDRANTEAPTLVDLEQVAYAYLLDHLEEAAATDDETDTATDDEGADDLEGELRDLYEEGLDSTIEGNRQTAIGSLMDAWGHQDAATDGSERLALGAGVALAAHISDDPALSMVYDEIIETAAGRRDKLPGPARPVLEALTDGSPGRMSADLRDQAAEVDGLERLEARAFARLLAQQS